MLNIMSKELLHTITETQASAALKFSDVTYAQAKDSLAAPIDSSSTGKEKETSPIDVEDVTLKVKSAPLRKKDYTQATQKEDADAAIYIRRHMNENMQWQYANMTNAIDIWRKLKKRYEDIHATLLSDLINRWQVIRLLDYKSVDDYYQEVLRIKTQYEFCHVFLMKRISLRKPFRPLVVK